MDNNPIALPSSNTISPKSSVNLLCNADMDQNSLSVKRDSMEDIETVCIEMESNETTPDTANYSIVSSESGTGSKQS